jgi:hypothetical protein
MKKKLLLLLVPMLVVTGSTFAKAATSAPYVIRWSPAQSSGFSWSLENLAADAPGNFNNFQKYFTSNVKLYDVIAAAGSTVKIQWKVTDGAGNPAANTAVTVVLNPAYTYPTATLSDPKLDPTKNQSDQSDRDPTKTDNADLPLTTDANGIVTFSVTNNTPLSNAENAIANDGTSVPPQSSKIFTQLQLYVGTFANTAAGLAARNAAQQSQDEDILEIHWENIAAAATVTPTPTPTPSPTPTPVKPDSNSIRWNVKGSSGVNWSLVNQLAINDLLKGDYFTSKVNFLDGFALAGSTAKLAWHVTDPSGRPLSNTPVTLIINPAYSNGTAKVNTSDGKPAPLAFGGNQDGIDVPLTTDANGDVFYSLTNTNDSSNGEAAPADQTTLPTGNVYTQLLMYTGTYANYAARTSPFNIQKIQDADILELHWISSMPSANPASNQSGNSGGLTPTDSNAQNVNSTPLPTLTFSKLAKVGTSLKVAYSNKNAGVSVSYKWFKCSKSGGSSTSLPGGCIPIKGASSNKFVLAKQYVGSVIRAELIVVFGSGTLTTFSSGTTVVK